MEMTPEKWQRVKVLFEAALDRPSEARLRYLADACSEDDLRAEVARLLTNLEDAGSFLNMPALTGLDLLTTRTEGGFLSVGRVLADRFKLTRFLARGGMGEVYEAEDLCLGWGMSGASATGYATRSPTNIPNCRPNYSRLIALPMSGGGSIARAASQYSPQSVVPYRGIPL